VNRGEHDEMNELKLNERERVEIERLIAGFRQEAKQQAERPEFFWTAQRTRIAARLRQARMGRGLGWAATVAAATAMVVFMTVPSHSPTTHAPRPGPTAAVHTPASDEELLRSVDETTSSNVPDALAPANLLATEMDRGLNGSSAISNTKTGRNNE
jgi:hypothetical protein